MLPWLWCRLVATAPVGPLAWEPPYAVGTTLERQKQTNKKNLNDKTLIFIVENVNSA